MTAKITVGSGGAGAAGASSFLDLSDTPAAYAGAATDYLRVNAAGDAVEFTAVGGVEGAHTHTHVVGRDVALSGIARYHYADGVNDEVQINQAIQAAKAVGGDVLVKAGNYSIRDAQATAEIVLESGVNIVGEGYKTYIKLANNQKDVISNDWWFQNIFADRAGVSNVRISHLRLDGNKANQTTVNASNQGAPIYFGHSGAGYTVDHCYVHDALFYGVFATALTGNVSDVKILNNRVTGSNFNDISVQCGGPDMADVAIIGNTIGGDTGDIGIDAESFSTGELRRITIMGNTCLEMTGTEGSTKPLLNWYAIRAERNTRHVAIIGNTVHQTMRGISTHIGTDGDIILANNVIYLNTAEADSKGMVIEGAGTGRHIVEGNHIIGDVSTAGNYGIRLTAPSCLIHGNYIYDCQYGIIVEAADYASISDNYLSSNTEGIRVSGDGAHISGNKLADTTGVVVLAAANDAWMDGNDFVLCATDVADAGTATVYGTNRDQSGNIDVGVEP